MNAPRVINFRAAYSSSFRTGCPAAADGFEGSCCTVAGNKPKRFLLNGEIMSARMVGQTISHYEIVAELGQGGMGVVYKARDTRLNRLTALKVLPPEALSNPERKQRFTQEARAASALNHPNIVHIYAIDQHEGVDFIAMEYVAGRTLA